MRKLMGADGHGARRAGSRVRTGGDGKRWVWATFPGMEQTENHRGSWNQALRNPALKGQGKGGPAKERPSKDCFPV